MSAPELLKPIPLIVINEGAAYGPLNLKEFIGVSDGEPPHFTTETADGDSLPAGLICTGDGIFTGIPARGTQGNYEVIVTAGNQEGSIETTFVLCIKPAYGSSEASYLDKIKKQVWEAIGEGLPIPELEDVYNRPLTPADIYYLLERWGILKIWDAFNLEPPGDRVPLKLQGASHHYNIYDRGSCLVATPVDLFSYERTLEDGLRTARAMAREVYQRATQEDHQHGWTTIELVGFDKFTRVAWLEIQHLIEKHGMPLQIVNYQPSTFDISAYNRVEEARKKYNPD